MESLACLRAAVSGVLSGNTRLRPGHFILGAGRQVIRAGHCARITHASVEVRGDGRSAKLAVVERLVAAQNRTFL
jgi:hypothetical protein